MATADAELARDTRGRALADVRVSVTDRCNLRCTYCMPREQFGPDHTFLPRAELLTFEEITRLVTVMAALGASKVRLTGGEPLLRTGLVDLVAMLTEVDGVDDLALTTNGVLLPPVAQPLRDAGLDRVTISLDALDPELFRTMADAPTGVEAVLAGVDAALEVGFDPVKVNCVVQKGVNESQIVPLATWGRERGVVVRYIEFMDVGTTNGWRLDDVVPSAEVLARLDASFGVEPVGAARPGEVAQRYRYTDGGGEVGVVSSVTQAFCSTCTRARLSAVGELFTCLFAAHGRDLRALVRGGADDMAIRTAIGGIWASRDDRYSEIRTAATSLDPKVEMSYIGG